MKKAKKKLQKRRSDKAPKKTYGKANDKQSGNVKTQMAEAIKAHQAGQISEAEAIYNQVLETNPNHPKALNLLGTIAVSTENIETGIDLISRSIALDSEDADAHTNLGCAFILLERHNEALEEFDHSLTLNPDSPTTLGNRGICLRHIGRTQDSINSFRRAIILKPELAIAHHNLSFALLSNGQEEEGLAEMEWRWQNPMFDFTMRDFSKPMWDGTANLNDRTLRLWPEQGPGDMIIWASRLEEVIKLSKCCIVQIYPKLAPLFARSFPNAIFEIDGGIEDVGLKNREQIDFDFHLPMGSLFYHLQPTPTLPIDAYLSPDPKRVDFWRKKLNNLGSGPYIGISWTSGLTSPARMHNYTRIDDWGPVFQNSAQFVNIQFGDYQNDIDQARKMFNTDIHTFKDLDVFDDIDDLAALSKALDLVISVSTIAAPLAASVGTPTWLISWKQSPWNNLLLSARGPNVTYFERNTNENWSAVFESIAKQLQNTFNLPISSKINSRSNSLSIDEAVKKFSDGRVAEAEEICRSALELNPKNPHALCLLGTIAYTVGQSEEALNLTKKAIALKPDFASAHANLGIILKSNGQVEEALKSIDYALKLNPILTEAINTKGVILETLGDLDEAIIYFQECLKLKPDSAEAYNNIGNIHLKRDQLKEAMKNYQKALDINPNYDKAQENMGLVLQKTEDFIEAIQSYVQAISKNPNYFDNHNGLGSLLLDIGELDEAIASFQRAITLAPNHSTAAHNYLFALLYIPGLDNSQLFDEYCRLIHPSSPVQENKSAGIFVDSSSSNVGLGHITPKREKRLRIGYVSSDFHNHPVGNNVLPLITNHDQKAFEVFCYANLQRSDEITKKIKSHSNHWRKINGLSDEQVAQKIKDDKIHILILLGGHFDKNRPNIATHRASPIQVSMHGGTTTALEAMDYWMTDALLHPPDTDPNIAEKFTETLCRLPNFYAYPCPENTPAVSALPADKNDFITFASFNKPCKMNDEVLDLWSQVLLAVPRSQLILKFRNFFASPLIKQKIETRFEINGIDLKRINMLSSADNMHDHLVNYHQADIALDTFPFAGATTTFQALWMGVPVISLLGDRFISRAGGVISLQAGLKETIATNKDEFIEKAIVLAGDKTNLRKTRKTLRQKLIDSPLCNGPMYARNVENTFQSMWVAHLKKE
jgi:predicted O-linked N-acetylglucosamine transferase (SPINDLY family)